MLARLMSKLPVGSEDLICLVKATATDWCHAAIQELMELTMATVAATQRAAWAKERASAAQEIACIAQTHKVAAIARARVAEEALAAAQTDKERLRTVACAALVWVPPAEPS